MNRIGKIQQATGWDTFENDVPQQEASELAKLTSRVFGTSDGKKLLDYLVERHITKPIATPNSDIITIGIRQGQANIVLNILEQIDKTKEL